MKNDDPWNIVGCGGNLEYMWAQKRTTLGANYPQLAPKRDERSTTATPRFRGGLLRPVNHEVGGAYAQSQLQFCKAERRPKAARVWSSVDAEGRAPQQSRLRARIDAQPRARSALRQPQTKAWGK